MQARTAAGMRLASDSHQPKTFPSLTSFEPVNHVAVPIRLSAFGKVSRCSMHGCRSRAASLDILGMRTFETRQRQQ
jgi:hypothetical protein